MTPLARGLLVLFVLWTGTAHAGPAEDARALYDEGQRLYDAGEYDAAVARWTEGYELSQAPAFLYNIAQAHRLAGRCTEALAFYRRFRDSATGDGPSGREAVDRRIEEMDRCVAAEEEKRRAEAPPVSTPTSTAASPPAETSPGDGATLRWLGIGFGAIAAIAGGGSLYYGLDALEANDDIETLWSEGGTFDDGARAIEARGERSESRAVWLGVTAGACLVTGVALYWLGARDTEVSVSPTGVAWSGRF